MKQHLNENIHPDKLTVIGAGNGSSRLFLALKTLITGVLCSHKWRDNYPSHVKPDPFGNVRYRYSKRRCHKCGLIEEDIDQEIT